MEKNNTELNTSPSTNNLLTDVREIIVSTRSDIAAVVNKGLTLLHWRVGKRILEDILANKRAGYGDEIVSTLSRQLTTEYGRGYSAKNLRHMI